MARIPGTLQVDGMPHRIKNLSMNGVAFYATETTETKAIGDQVAISLLVGPESAYEGHGEIVRLEEGRRGSLIGLRLAPGFIDIARLIRRHDELAVRWDLDRGADGELDLVAPEYRQLCADMLYELRHYRSLAERSEQLMRTDGTIDAERYEQTRVSYFTRLAERWERLRARANVLCEPAFQSGDVLAAYKRLTERLVATEFLNSPAGHRCRDKPLGYPGDFIIMNYFYEQAWRGDHLYGELLHKLVVSHPLARCVTPRMEMLRSQIAATQVRFRADSQPIRIANLGSGPAREMETFLSQGMASGPLHLTLIDQDEQALSFAHDRIRAAAAKADAVVDLQCLHLSFGQLLSSPLFMDGFASQHLVYTAGLVDYLREGTARRVIAALFSRLAPGGTLVVGNMRRRNDVAWTPEFLLDWSLIYRDEAEMLALAAGLNTADVRLELDPSGCTYLLFLKSRG